MNIECTTFEKIISLLDKKVSKKLTTLKQSLDQAKVELKELSKINQVKITDPTPQPQKQSEPFQQKLKNVVQLCLMIYLEIHTSQQPHSIKIYELADYLLILLIIQQVTISKEQVMLAVIQLRLDAQILLPESHPTLLYQLVGIRSKYCSSVYLHVMFNHLVMIDIISQQLNSPGVQQLFVSLISNQIQTLYRYGKEGELIFVQDYQFTDHWMKEFFEFQKMFQKSFHFSYVVGPYSGKPVFPALLVEHTASFVSFTFECVSLIFRYLLYQWFQGDAHFEQYVLSFTNVLLEEYVVLKSRLEYLLQINKLIYEVFENIIQDVKTVDQIKAESFYVSLLLYINFQFKMSLTLQQPNLEIFKLINNLFRLSTMQIVNFASLRDFYFQIYDTFLLKTLVSKTILFQFKIQVMMYIHSIISRSQQSVNMFIQLFDVNMQLPLMRKTMEFLIFNMNTKGFLEQKVQLKSFTINTLFQVDESFCFDAAIFESQRQVIMSDQQDLIFLILTKILRVIKDISHNYSNDIQKSFQLISCLKIFNSEPEKVDKAFSIFQKYGFVTDRPEDAVIFIIANYKQLNPSNIGQLFGGKEEINKILLDAYSHQVFQQVKQKFTNNLAEFYSLALRNFLKYFKLPGESQQIDRIMQKFSHQFAMHQSIIDQQSAYVLSYATMMLNTDMHNYSVNVKMTKDGFIKNTKNADKKNQLSQQFLGDLYDEIQINPITLDEIELQRAVAIYGETGFYEYKFKQISTSLKSIYFSPTNATVKTPIIILEKFDQIEKQNDELQIQPQDDENGISQQKEDENDVISSAAAHKDHISENIEQSGSKFENNDQIEEVVEQTANIETVATNTSYNEILVDQPSELIADDIQLEQTGENSNAHQELGVIANQSVITNPQFKKQNQQNVQLDDILLSLIQQNNVQNLSVILIEYMYEELFQEFIKYTNSTIFEKRFQWYQEVVFQLFRLAQIHVDCKHYRSVILNRLAINVHCAMAQFCPYSQYIIENTIQFDFTRFESVSDALNLCSKQIAEDLCLGIQLITLVDPFVPQTSYDLLVSAYINSITMIQAYQLFKGNDKEIREVMIIMKNSKDKLQDMYLYEYFITSFNKRISILNEQFKKLGEAKMMTGHIFRYSDNFKVVKTLFGLMEFYTLDADRFAQFLVKPSKIQLPISLICIQQLFHSISDIYFMIMTFNRTSKQFEYNMLQNLDDIKNDNLVKSIMENCCMPLSVDNLYQYCVKYLQDSFNYIGSLFAYSGYYSNLGTYQLIFSKQIIQIVTKFVNVVDFLDISPNLYFPLILQNFCHLVKLVQTQPALTEFVTYILTSITQFNDRFTKYEYVVPFIHRALIRPLQIPLPIIDFENQNLYACKQCHSYQCEFQLILPQLPLTEISFNYVNNYDWSDCIGQLQTILQYLPNITSCLTEENCLIYFDQLIQISKSYQNRQILTMVMRCCDLALSRLYHLQNNDLLTATSQLVQDVILNTMIDKSLANKYEALQQAYVSFNSIVNNIIYEEKLPFWSDLEVKKRSLNLLFDKPIKAIILQQRKDRQYQLFDTLSIVLYEVFHNNKNNQKLACLYMLDELLQLSGLFMATKVPTFDKFKALSIDTFKNLILSFNEGNEKVLHDTIINTISLITTNLSSNVQILSDDISIEMDFNMKIMYLVEFLKSFDDIISQCDKLSNKICLEFYEIIYRAVDNIYKQLCDTQSRTLDNQTILSFVDFFIHQVQQSLASDGDLNRTKGYFNASGFKTFLRLADILIYYQNSANSKYYIDLCIEYLNVSKDILAKSNQMPKLKQLYNVVIAFSMFNNVEIRQFFFSFLVHFNEHVLDRIIK